MRLVFCHGPPFSNPPSRASIRCNIHEVCLLSRPAIWDFCTQNLDQVQYSWEDGGFVIKANSQENFEYPNGIFSEHWQKTREGYCSVIEANLIIKIEAWLEKSVFRFKVENFERRMNSNFKQNQILILGQNAWPGLTVTENIGMFSNPSLLIPFD